MDVAAMSVVMKNSQVRQAASTAILQKVMDVNKQQMQKMLEMSVEPHIGGNVDIRI